MHTFDDKTADIPRAQQAPSLTATDPFREATDRLRAEIETTFTALKRSLYVQREAIGLSVFDWGFRMATFACAGAVVLALTIFAAWMLVSSARRGLALWTGDAWWSDLVLVAVLAIALPFGAHGLRRHVHRSALARARRALSQNPRAVA